MADPAVINARNAQGIREIIEIVKILAEVLPQVLALVKELKDDLKILQDILDVNKVGGQGEAVVARLSQLEDKIGTRFNAIEEEIKLLGMAIAEAK